MSDDNKKLLDDLGDLEWDSALDEWEKNTFVPEVAKDAETNKAAPSPEPVDDEEQAREHLRAAASGHGSGSGVAAAGFGQGSLNEVSGEGMVMAPVPRELRDQPREPSPRVASPKPPLSAPPQRASVIPGSLRGGGLGQLFAKCTSVRPPPPPPPPPPAPLPVRAP